MRNWDFKNRYFANPLGDLMGGLMAAVVALPLCLAFGVASGLGAIAGLYGAIACGVFAALLGGTPAQCSGPTGPMTVVAASLFVANSNRPEIVFAAVMAAGVIQVFMGWFKTGRLISYVPYPVISGFMTGIGAIIVCIEIAPLFGLPVSGSVLVALQEMVAIPQQLNMQATLVGVSALALIVFLPKISRKLPASLIALVVSTWVAAFLKLDIPRIGQIPSGIPLPNLPIIGLSDLHVVLQCGLTLAFLGAIDSLLTAVVLDKVTGGKHDSDQELIGQGAGNFIAGLIGGLPGAGATMRSMVNVKSGGTTYLSGIIHGLLLLAILLCFGQVASSIPLAALAAILLVVGFSIMDWRVLRRLAKIPKADALVMIVVLCLTIFVDLIVAVLVGVALASVLFVRNLTEAQSSAISDLDSMQEQLVVSTSLPTSLKKSVYIYTLNSPLFFGEAKNLTRAIDQLSEARYVILHFLNVPFVDQTGAYALENAIDRWEEKGIKILFVGMAPHIRSTLEGTGAIHKIDMDNCFHHLDEAVNALERYEMGGSGKETAGLE